MSSTFVDQTLSNGLRIVCEVMPRVRSAAVAFLVNTGSRHEGPDNHGVSHFLEHMCFKGTPTRSSLDINIRFDELGSIYNAFTGKEHTVYYGCVPAQRCGEQLELIADMMRPSLPPEDYETERKVILEEIAMSDDNFDRHVYAFLHETLFATHPLAHEILGEKESIERMPRERMLTYHAARYAPRNMILMGAGALDPQRLFDDAQRLCGAWSGEAPAAAVPARGPFPTGVRTLKLERFKKQSLVLLFPAAPHGHPLSETLDIFTSVLGGANSRCFWNIVQQGIATSAGATWLSYADCGFIALYADGEPQRCEEMLAALRTEAQRVMRDGVTDEELARVKNRRRTQVALEAESPRTRMMQLIDDLEGYNRPRPAEERLAAIEAVTAPGIADCLANYPIDGEGLLLSVGPRQWPE